MALGYKETKDESTTPYQSMSFVELFDKYRKDNIVISFNDQLLKLKTLIDEYIKLNEIENKNLFPLNPNKLIKAQRLKSLKEIYNFFNDLIENPNKFTKKNYENRAENYNFSFVTQAIENRALNPDTSKSRSEILIGLMYVFLGFYSKILQLRGTAPEEVCTILDLIPSDYYQLSLHMPSMNYKNQFYSEVKGLLTYHINQSEALSKQQVNQIKIDDDTSWDIAKIVTAEDFVLTFEKVKFAYQLLKSILTGACYETFVVNCFEILRRNLNCPDSKEKLFILLNQLNLYLIAVFELDSILYEDSFFSPSSNIPVNSLIRELCRLSVYGTSSEKYHKYYAYFICKYLDNFDEKLLELADNDLLAQLAIFLFKKKKQLAFKKVVNAGASIFGARRGRSSLFDRLTPMQAGGIFFEQEKADSYLFICIKKLYKSEYSIFKLVTKLLDKNASKSIEYLFSLLNQTEKKSIFQDEVITARLIALNSPKIDRWWFLSLDEHDKFEQFESKKEKLLIIALQSSSPEMLDYCLNKINDDEVHAFATNEKTQTELRKIFTESGNFYMQVYCYCTDKLMLGQELGHLPDDGMKYLLAHDQLKSLSQLEKAQVLNFLLNPELKERRSSAKLLMGRCHLHDSQVIHDLAVQIAMFTPGLAYYQGHPLSQKALRTSLILLNQKLITLETEIKGPLKDKHAKILAGREKPVSAGAFAAASAVAPAGSAVEAKGIDGYEKSPPIYFNRSWSL